MSVVAPVPFKARRRSPIKTLLEFQPSSSVLSPNIHQRGDGTWVVWNQCHKTEVPILAGDYVCIDRPDDLHVISRRAFDLNYDPV